MYCYNELKLFIKSFFNIKHLDHAQASVYLQGYIGIAEVNDVDIITQAPLSLSPRGVILTTLLHVILLL